MISKRLLCVASFVNKDDKLIDVGCDHGYLGIYLKKNNLVSDLLLTDVNNNALNNAINNINNNDLDIKYMLTDGINNIDLDKYNTISISGMGTHTILKILKDNEGFPKVFLVTPLDDVLIMVMELLGDNLQKLIQNQPEKKFTLKTTLLLGIQILKRIRLFY